MRQEEMMHRFKEELFDKYSSNFNQLQQTLQSIKQQNQQFQAQAHLSNSHMQE
jgi:hypothetical protein